MSAPNITTSTLMSVLNNITIGTVLVGGLVAMALNIIFLAALLKHPQLRQSCVTLIGLTGVHVVTGFVHVLMGVRSYVASPDDAMKPATIGYCWAIIHPSLSPFVFQSIPLTLTVVAIERLLAFAAPVWFRVHWNRRLATAATCLPIGLSITSITSQWIKALVKGTPATKACGRIFDQDYYTFFHFGMNMVCGVVATICISIAIRIGRRRLQNLPQSSGNEIARAQKQMRLTKCMLAVACIDVVCVVLPNVHMFLESYDLYHIPPEYGRITAILFCSNSTLDIVVYVTMSKEFRQAVLDLLKRGNSVSSVNLSNGSGARAGFQQK